MFFPALIVLRDDLTARLFVRRWCFQVGEMIKDREAVIQGGMTGKGLKVTYIHVFLSVVALRQPSGSRDGPVFDVMRVYPWSMPGLVC